MCAENYQNRDRFDKDIAKIKQGSFFASHGRLEIAVFAAGWLLWSTFQVEGDMPHQQFVHGKIGQ